jgi:hypothetical protein
MAAETQKAESWLSRQVGRQYRLLALVLAAAVLSVGALAGVASTAGYGHVWRTLVYPHGYWLPLAFAGEAFAYLGYTIAYRELTRAEQGPELDVPSLAALVTTGFGVFIRGGGFALDRAALERAGLSKREARERVLGLGTLEYAILAPATLAAAAYLLIVDRPSIDPSLILPWLIGVPVGTALTLLALRHKRLFRRRGWRMRIYNVLTAIGLVLHLF